MAMTTTNDAAETVVKDTLAALERDVRVDMHAYPIGVREENGSLVLSGTAEDIVAKRLAASYAWRHAGNRFAVVDRLRVATDKVEDHALRDALVGRLGGDPVFAEITLVVEAQGDGLLVHDAGPGADHIEVQVDNGHITLTGRVPSLSHLRLAEVLVWWTPGTAAIENLLEVMPPEADSDDEITDALRIVLEKDPLVHAHQLRPGTAGGVVVMAGVVGSDEERRLALADAWYVPGVSDVVDHIALREPVAR
jgi:osmotically-inducible protein OsmY